MQNTDERIRVNNSVLQVTDTPGLCDTHRVKEEMLDEVARSVAVASPGPHVILMALRCDMPYTKVCTWLVFL